MLMNPLDRFFKDKLENRQITMNDAHWREAEKLLNKRDKKRPTWFWAGILSLFFLLLGGIWWAIATKYDATQNKTLRTEKIGALAVEQKTESQLQENNTAIQESEDLLGNENPEIAIKKTVTAARNIHESQVELKGTSQTKPDVQGQDYQKNQEPKSAEEEVKNTTQNKVVANGMAPQLDQKSGDTKGEKEPIITLENPSVFDTATKESGISIDALPVVMERLDFLPILALQQLERSTSGFILSQPDQIKTPKQLSLGLHVMEAFYPGFQAGNSKLLGSNVGLDIRLSGRSRWGLRSGFNYRIRNGQYSFTDSLTEVAYSFGRIEKQYTLTPRAVHFVELPVLVSYRLGRHELQGGVQLAYLLGVKGQLEVPLEDLPARRTIQTGWIEKTGFKQIKFDLSLGYHYAITTHWKAGVYLHYTPVEWWEQTSQSTSILNEDGKLLIDVGVRFDLF
ncbi:MAG: hypothetical protein DHS20C18_36050 [Saprospiraceae bacterium]|nr:MAG: hypothetical protein DHS20C18_36050 [Saprospiraceae bacterium]